MLRTPQFEVAEQEWELLAQKRATLAVAAANRWRQKLYLRLGGGLLVKLLHYAALCCTMLHYAALCCTMLHCTQRIKVQMAFICLAQLPAEEERNDLWMPIRFNHCQWARALSRPGNLKGFTDLFSNSGKNT